MKETKPGELSCDFLLLGMRRVVQSGQSGALWVTPKGLSCGAA